MRGIIGFHGLRSALIALGGALCALTGSSVSAFAISAGCQNVNNVGPVAPGIAGFSVAGAFAVGDTVSFATPAAQNFAELSSMQDGLSGRYSQTAVPPASFTYTYTSASILDFWGFLNGSVASATPHCTPGVPGSGSSQNLHSLEIAATQTVATLSGQVITGAVENAIGDAFNNGAAPFTPGPNGLFLNFAAEPQRDAATEEALDALAYAGKGGMVYKTPPPAPLIASEWSAWADLRGTGFDQSSASTHEEQINVTGGIGRKLSPDLLVGLFTGYENFSFTMESIAGKMTGDGGTIGGYAAWHYAEHWRADAMLGWTDMFYNGTAGTASGSFTGSRWLGSGGFTGTYRYAGFVLEPSARIYTLWESDTAFTDSLGTAQPVNNFSTSRVSVGNKVSYPWPTAATLSVVPYLGLYTDFRFSTTSALPVGIPDVGVVNGWSERVTTGVTITKDRNGPSLSLEGELGGLGAGYDIWSANVRANWPF